jgi:hypothetical protein
MQSLHPRRHRCVLPSLAFSWSRMPSPSTESSYLQHKLRLPHRRQLPAGAFLLQRLQGRCRPAHQVPHRRVGPPPDPCHQIRVNSISGAIVDLRMIGWACTCAGYCDVVSFEGGQDMKRDAGWMRRDHYMWLHSVSPWFSLNLCCLSRRVAHE